MNTMVSSANNPTKIKDVWKIIIEHEIVRRYVIINSFDGVLTIFGIIIAEFLSKITDPKLIILPGVGAAVAMCVSGMWGAYAAERSEVKKSIRALEAHMLKDLSDTEFSKKRERMAWFIGIIDGLNSLIVSLVILVPFFMSSFGLITINLAYFISLILVGSALFLLGVFAGRIAKENILKHGLIMLLAGFVIAGIFIFLTFIGVM